jgi:hypothetical protein
MAEYTENCQTLRSPQGFPERVEARIGLFFCTRGIYCFAGQLRNVSHQLRGEYIVVVDDIFIVGRGPWLKLNAVLSGGEETDLQRSVPVSSPEPHSFSFFFSVFLLSKQGYSFICSVFRKTDSFR